MSNTNTPASRGPGRPAGSTNDAQRIVARNERNLLAAARSQLKSGNITGADRFLDAARALRGER